jgi:hypothetical protein
MNKFQDPLLLPKPSVDYTMVDLFGYSLPVTFSSLGYGLLFYGASFWIMPVSFSKILPFLIMPITLWYLFEFGQSVRDRRMGVILAVAFLFINLASSSSISIANGLQRSFALSLMVALIYYLHRQRYMMAGVIILVSAFVYAPAFALGVMMWGLLVLKRWGWPFRLGSLRVQRGLVQLLVAFGLGIFILLPGIFPSLADRFTHQPPILVSQPTNIVETAAEAEPLLWNNPIYRADGPVQLFVVFPFVGRGGLVDLGEDVINLLILLALGGLIYLVLGRRAFELPEEIWSVLWAGFILFFVAWIPLLLASSFLFYVPSRYTRVGLFLFFFMLVFLNSQDFIKEAPALIRRNFHKLIWFIAAIEVIVLGIIIFYPSERAMINGFNMKWLLALTGIAFGTLGIAIVKKPPSSPNVIQKERSSTERILAGAALAACLLGWAVYAPILTETSYLNPPPIERQMLKFLETLPKDALIAGTPCALDSIPLFAKRQVMFSCEAYGDDSKLIREALAAYYAADWSIVANFCRSHQVNYLVLDLKTYSKEYLTTERVFFEPYKQELLAHLAGRESFVLAQTPDDIKLFQAGSFFAVSCDKIEQL